MGCFCFCKPNAIGPFGRCLGSHLTDGGPIRRLSGSNTFLKCTRTAGEVSRSLFFSFIETQCTRGGKNKNTAGCVPRCIGTSGVMKRGTLSAPISSLSGDTAEGSRGKTHPQGEKATVRIGKAEREELFLGFFSAWRSNQYRGPGMERASFVRRGIATRGEIQWGGSEVSS